MDLMNINVDDLVINKDQVMMRQEICDLINDAIVPLTKWKVEELADGKEIDIFPEWKKDVEPLIWAYRRGGWEVFHFLSKGRDYLSFTNPRKATFIWRKKT